MGSGFKMMGGGYENPEPLPSTVMSDIALVRDPFPQVYQGVRRRSLDKRVFKKEFDYAAADTGRRILCESFVECVVRITLYKAIKFGMYFAINTYYLLLTFLVLIPNNFYLLNGPIVPPCNHEKKNVFP